MDPRSWPGYPRLKGYPRRSALRQFQPQRPSRGPLRRLQKERHRTRNGHARGPPLHRAKKHIPLPGIVGATACLALPPPSSPFHSLLTPLPPAHDPVENRATIRVARPSVGWLVFNSPPLYPLTSTSSTKNDEVTKKLPLVFPLKSSVTVCPP